MKSKFTRFVQISESHCGPATIEMLLNNLGVDVSQEAIAEAGGATKLIEMNGMRVDQLAVAVSKLAPSYQFWYKERANIQEIVRLVNVYGYPVGVEWQGVFEDEQEGEVHYYPENEDCWKEGESDDEYGHFSVIAYADEQQKQFRIVDPYKDYISRDRVFTFRAFECRWYDYNELQDPDSGKPIYVEDYHMLFIITPKNETFPLELEMKRGEEPRKLISAA